MKYMWPKLPTVQPTVHLPLLFKLDWAKCLTSGNEM